MQVLLALSVLGLISKAFAGECKYSRRSGLFMNEFQNATDPEFGGANFTDTDPAVGNEISITFKNSLSILGTDTNTLKIADNGFVGLAPVATQMYEPSVSDRCNTYLPFDMYGSVEDCRMYEVKQFAANGDPRLGNYQNVPFAVSRWFGNTSLDVYEFSIEYLDRSDIVVGGFVVKSLCTLERIEAIISDCQGSTSEYDIEPYGTMEVIEAAIITFLHNNTEATVHQLVFAQTVNTTYVLCLYGDNNLKDVPSSFCYINGYYITPTVWQGFCPGINGSINEQSNCDCGNWNAGVYVFNTSLASSQTNEQCTGDYETNCDVNSAVPHYLRNRYCRPAMEPVDTCREDVSCQMMATGGTGFWIKLMFRDDPLYTEVVFLDQSQWKIGNILPMNSSICNEMIINGMASFHFDAATVPDCDVTLDGKVSNFVVMTRDANSTQDLFVKDGYRVLKVQCSFYDLVNNVTLAPEFGTFGNESIDTPADRTVDLFVSTAYNYTSSPVNTKLPPNELVYLGQDLFLTLCYSQGKRPFQENAEPYGAWPLMCYVSNSPIFPKDSNSVELVDNTGCRTPYAKTASNAFYVQQEFKVTSTQLYKLPGNDYDWCMTSGKIDAAKWVISDFIYFRCYVKYCKNLALRDSTTEKSKCENSCTGKTDLEARRKRATEDEETVVQTSIKVQAVQSEPVSECADMMAAIATIVSLLVLLMMALCLTMLLIVKLQRRYRTIKTKPHRH